MITKNTLRPGSVENPACGKFGPKRGTQFFFESYVAHDRSLGLGWIGVLGWIGFGSSLLEPIFDCLLVFGRRSLPYG